jgi:ParB family chromosome partitioning protein
LRLLSLDGEIQGFLSKNLLSPGHAKALLGVEDTAQRSVLARRVITEGLSVRDAEKLAQSAKSAAGRPRGPRRKGQPSQDAAAVAGIQQKLTSHLGARVAVLHTPRRGRIVIEYRGNEDLQRILGKLGLPEL